MSDIRPLSTMSRAERRAVAKNVRTLAKQSWKPFEKLPETVPYHPDGRLKMAYRNNLYSVQEFAFPGGVTKLMIRRHDDQPMHNWKHLQRIKNEICGPEAIAIEVYPAESELVDVANIYWLFVMPPGFVMPWKVQP